MADIRINALATTATSAASDDYLALDGSANGTRKILATNVAQNVTDVTLGSSGPSVKSTLSARAPRQGLVFDGTAGATATATVSALGTSPYTYEIVCTPTSFATQTSLADTQNGLLIYVPQTTGLVTIYDRVANTQIYQASTALAIGKANHIVYSRASGFYLNGVALSTSITDASNYTGTALNLGSDFGGNNRFIGTLSARIYNRALSASEVVSLYEAGAPAGADYNSASNTALNTVAPTLVGGGTLSGTSATGFTFTGSSATGYVLIPAQSTPALSYAGTKFRVTFTASITTGTVTFSGRGVSAIQNTTSVSAGSNSFIITFGQAMTSNNSCGFEFDSSGTATYAISGLSIQPLGLLLAPDAAQAGGGLTWYDTSGNAANITLPASGVSWNVPSSRVLGGNWTNTGNFTLSTSGSSINTGTSNASDSAYISLSGGGAAGNGRGSSVYVTGNEFTTGNAKGSLQLEAGYDATMSNILDGSVLFGTGGTAVVGYFNRLGNLILGPAAADGGNGKLQLATHTTSAGGIGFGTDWSLYRVDQYSIGLNGTAGGSQLRFYESGTLKGLVGTSSGNSYLDSLSGSIIFRTNSGTTALTLDSSQRTILSGALRLNNAYTAGAPTATGYVTIQDSAGNTYKVLVGT